MGRFGVQSDGSAGGLAGDVRLLQGADLVVAELDLYRGDEDAANTLVGE
jgi:hypothetical protein